MPAWLVRNWSSPIREVIVPTGTVAVTQTIDGGLRTLSGGQYSIEVDGFLAIENGAAPDVMIEATHSVRDIYAVVREAPADSTGPTNSPIQIRLNQTLPDQSPTVYCTLNIPSTTVISRSAGWISASPLGSRRTRQTGYHGCGRYESGLGSDRHHSALSRMPETLQKLRPDRDLQCYFLTPSAIAALSEASAAGFTVSGSWRQQFDWAVIEWNRDNIFEHPLLRNLPGRRSERAGAFLRRDAG